MSLVRMTGFAAASPLPNPWYLSCSVQDWIFESEFDYVFDAAKIEIDEIFVKAYGSLLLKLTAENHSRVLVADTKYLHLFPSDHIVVPTLVEANDVIEMERIERDLGF